MPYPVQIARFSGETVSYRKCGTGPRRVLFFHGFPGSSFQTGLFDAHLLSAGLSVVGIDRPGYGSSSPAASRSRSQLAQGVHHCEGVLTELGWDEFEILAVSGGTPLALNLAHALGSRVTRTTIACGLGPLGDARAGSLMSRKARAALTFLPRLPGAFVKRVLASPAKKSPAALRRDLSLLRYLFDASPADQEVLGRELVQQSLVQAKTEAFAQGGVGPQADALSYLTPWGWDLAQFSGAVRFFHGSEDRVIPASMAQFMASLIPAAELHLIEGEGHFSLPVRHLARMLE